MFLRRGAPGRDAGPRQHRAGLRHRRDGRHVLLRDGVPARRGPALDHAQARPRRRQRLPLQQALTIVIGAAAGLHYAHEKKALQRAAAGHRASRHVAVEHRRQLRRRREGRRLRHREEAADPEQSKRDALKGKLAYMSPEQLHNRPIDRRSDVFALGIVLYEITHARAAVQGPDRSGHHAHGARGIDPGAVDARSRLSTRARADRDAHAGEGSGQALRVGARSAARSRGVCARSAPAHLVAPGWPTGWRRALDPSARSGTRCPRRRRRRRRRPSRSPPRGSWLTSRSRHPTRRRGPRRRRQLGHAGHEVAARAATGETVVGGGRWLPSSSASGRWRSPPRCGSAAATQPRRRPSRWGARPARRSSCWWPSAAPWPSSPEPPVPRVAEPTSPPPTSPTITAMAPPTAPASAAPSPSPAPPRQQRGRRPAANPVAGFSAALTKRQGEIRALFREVSRGRIWNQRRDLAALRGRRRRTCHLGRGSARGRGRDAAGRVPGQHRSRARCSRRNPLPSRFVSRSRWSAG